MKAAVIGGGVIGGGWAARFLLMGWDIAVFDPAPDAARKVTEVVDGARRALPMLYDQALPAEGTLHVADSLSEALNEANWVQESVPERLDLKHKVLSDIQSQVTPGTIVASSTSGFTPTELQEGAKRPADIIVAHPFNPVYLLPVVEVVGSDATQPETLDRAEATLRQIGMAPIRIRKEMAAHVADRLLEAVWREALWLIKDGVATTEEIDDVIRLGFGLRWGQMGLFETYRIAGGEDGMAHFLGQFGPALNWPWTKLMDVPELNDDLVATIAAQSDAQSGQHTIRELERTRDDNLVAMMRALRQRGSAAGAVLRDHEATLPQPFDPGPPMIALRRTIPVDWTDYNGHMNESRYGQVFSDAADAVMLHLGADETYIAGGHSFFTVGTTVAFKAECHAGDAVEVRTEVREAAGKKLVLFHEIRRDDTVCATCEQVLIHVSLTTRRSCPPLPKLAEAMSRLVQSATGPEVR